MVGKEIKIEDVIDERMEKHYFCLPLSSQDKGQWTKEVTSILDGRSIDKLLEFIGLGEDDEHAASGTKSKKKEKKKKEVFSQPREIAESMHTDWQVGVT